MISQKMCMIGDFGVGKTSLIHRFVDRQFRDQYLSTVGVKISRKAVKLPQRSDLPAQVVQLLIWDLEGHTKFKSLAPSYLQGSKGALVVGDVTRPETLEHLGEHIQLFLSVNPKGVLILALNKTDLIDTQKLEKRVQIVQEQHTKQIIALYHTSAKTGENVDEIFSYLVLNMVR